MFNCWCLAALLSLKCLWGVHDDLSELFVQISLTNLYFVTGICVLRCVTSCCEKIAWSDCVINKSGWVLMSTSWKEASRHAFTTCSDFIEFTVIMTPLWLSVQAWTDHISAQWHVISSSSSSSSSLACLLEKASNAISWIWMFTVDDSMRMLHLHSCI